MPGKDKIEISINANPTGTLEIEEFKNRMALRHKGTIFKNKKIKLKK